MDLLGLGHAESGGFYPYLVGIRDEMLHLVVTIRIGLGNVPGSLPHICDSHGCVVDRSAAGIGNRAIDRTVYGLGVGGRRHDQR